MACSTNSASSTRSTSDRRKAIRWLAPDSTGVLRLLRRRRNWECPPLLPPRRARRRRRVPLGQERREDATRMDRVVHHVRPREAPPDVELAPSGSVEHLERVHLVVHPQEVERRPGAPAPAGDVERPHAARRREEAAREERGAAAVVEDRERADAVVGLVRE